MLPEGLEVKEDLVIEESAIQNLPDGLKVGGSLRATGSALKTIGRGVEVGRDFKASNTCLEALPDDLRMRPSLPYWRTFEIASTAVKSLPDMDVEFSEVHIGVTGIENFPAAWKTGTLHATDSALAKVEGRAKLVVHTSSVGIDCGTRRVKLKFAQPPFSVRFKKTIATLFRAVVDFLRGYSVRPRAVTIELVAVTDNPRYQPQGVSKSGSSPAACESRVKHRSR
jgi:hypothetical protein